MANTKQANVPSPADLTALAREHARTAIAALAEVAAKGGSDAARVSAANALLDRGYGRTAQATPEDAAADEWVDAAELACLDDEELAQLATLTQKIAASGQVQR